MKIYTKTGDEGQTGLANGTRVFKDHLRVELYGTSDELNSVIGLGLSFLAKEQLSGQGVRADFQWVEEQIHSIQSLLFELGAELAGFPTEEGSIVQNDVDQIEGWIDEMNAGLPEMKQFILPGGEKSSAQFHISRTVCRRLERLLVAANRSEEVESILGSVGMIWVNRLSDYLFVLARHCQKLNGGEDIPWKSRMQRPSRSRKN
ncbi:MAG: cob(I)yrinic acid a,c-diamide adenosyltransferase [Leptospiraceae bacterium]